MGIFWTAAFINEPDLSLKVLTTAFVLFFPMLLGMLGGTLILFINKEKGKQKILKISIGIIFFIIVLDFLTVFLKHII